MKNDLRQSVDRAFAGATWDEAHARRVISKIEERKQPVMKRKLTVALVCALVLVLASAWALAAVFGQGSERSNVVLTARNALTRQYRFTPGRCSKSAPPPSVSQLHSEKSRGNSWRRSVCRRRNIPASPPETVGCMMHSDSARAA